MFRAEGGQAVGYQVESCIPAGRSQHTSGVADEWLGQPVCGPEWWRFWLGRFWAPDVQPFWHRPPRWVGKSRGATATPTPEESGVSDWAHCRAQYGQCVSTTTQTTSDASAAPRRWYTAYVVPAIST